MTKRLLNLSGLLLTLCVAFMPAINAAGVIALPIETHYATLGVEKTASSPQIKAAYRALVMTWHPDKVKHDAEKKALLLELKKAAWDASGEALNGPCPELSEEDFHATFQQVNEAFNILSDSEKRTLYDARQSSSAGSSTPIPTTAATAARKPAGKPSARMRQLFAERAAQACREAATQKFTYHSSDEKSGPVRSKTATRNFVTININGLDHILVNPYGNFYFPATCVRNGAKHAATPREQDDSRIAKIPVILNNHEMHNVFEKLLHAGFFHQTILDSFDAYLPDPKAITEDTITRINQYLTGALVAMHHTIDPTSQHPMTFTDATYVDEIAEDICLGEASKSVPPYYKAALEVRLMQHRNLLFKQINGAQADSSIQTQSETDLQDQLENLNKYLSHARQPKVPHHGHSTLMLMDSVATAAA